MKIIFLLGAAFSVYAFYVLVPIHDQFLTWWNVFNALLLIVTFLCAWGLWKRKRWSLPLSFLLALGAFGFGGYFVHFVWTFWIFEKPTFMENLLSTLHPCISVFVIMPLLWFAFFSRKSVREQFQGK